MFYDVVVVRIYLKFSYEVYENIWFSFSENYCCVYGKNCLIHQRNLIRFVFFLFVIIESNDRFVYSSSPSHQLVLIDLIKSQQLDWEQEGDEEANLTFLDSIIPWLLHCMEELKWEISGLCVYEEMNYCKHFDVLW